MKTQSNFVIIGAGPKALAVVAKSYVLNHLFALPMPTFHVIEKKEVGANWTGGNGFTNGNLRLGTSPQKDIGFPYNSKIFGNQNDARINREMRAFSWDMYLINNGKYAEWIDRGRPSPTHFEWAQYLKYGFSILKDYVHIHTGYLKEIFYNEKIVRIDFDNNGVVKTLGADYLMLTGPGESNFKKPIESTRIFDINSYWKSKIDFSQNEKILIVGGGENSATIVLDINQKFGNRNLDFNIVTPSGMIITRGESYFENRVYTDANNGHWDYLTRDEKISFIKHTDLGVYSVEAMNDLSRSANLNIIKGLVKGASELNGKVIVTFQDGIKASNSYDRVILANGFQKVGLLSSKLNIHSKKELECIIGKIVDKNLENKIGRDLSIKGIRKKIFLPMISGISQGPGFSNLSSLGTLSDRVLYSLISVKNKELYNVSN